MEVRTGGFAVEEPEKEQAYGERISRSDKGLQTESVCRLTQIAKRRLSSLGMECDRLQANLQRLLPSLDSVSSSRRTWVGYPQRSPRGPFVIHYSGPPL